MTARRRVVRPSGRISVLGLDPGTHVQGLVALDPRGELADWDRWEIPAGTLAERLTTLERGLTLAIAELRPAVLAYEYGRGIHAAPELDAYLRTLPALCRRLGVRAVKFVPSAWRAAAVGNGGVSKAGAADLLRRRYADLAEDLPWRACWLDVWDAAGVAKAAWERERDPRLAAMADAARHGDLLKVALKQKAGGRAAVTGAGGMRRLMAEW